VRRYCTLETEPRELKLRDGHPPPKASLQGGQLEKIIDGTATPAREALLWQNGFFGNRVRRRVRPGGWFKASNSPFHLHPEILDEVLKYVYLPPDVVGAYRDHANTKRAS